MSRRWGLFAVIWLLILATIYIGDRFVRDVLLTDDAPRRNKTGHRLAGRTPVPPALVERIEHDNALDMALYDYGRELVADRG